VCLTTRRAEGERQFWHALERQAVRSNSHLLIETVSPRSRPRAHGVQHTWRFAGRIRVSRRARSKVSAVDGVADLV
jgi:hypothetical protein